MFPFNCQVLLISEVILLLLQDNNKSEQKKVTNFFFFFEKCNISTIQVGMVFDAQLCEKVVVGSTS